VETQIRTLHRALDRGDWFGFYTSGLIDKVEVFSVAHRQLADA